MDELLRALNGRLKTGDIRIRAIDETFAGFDARSHARSKTYRYAIWNGPAPNPFIRHVVWHVPQPLDLDRMVAATTAVLGEHDFAAFQGSGSDVKTTVRRMLAAELAEVDINTDQPVALPALDQSSADRSNGRLLRFEITGTGFLRHMVRTIAGTLVDIGRGNIAPEQMAAIIASRDRPAPDRPHHAHGLMLWQVITSEPPRGTFVRNLLYGTSVMKPSLVSADDSSPHIVQRRPERYTQSSLRMLSRSSTAVLGRRKRPARIR